MRPIRFRAWDKQEKVMLPWETDYQVILDAIPSGAGDEWTERCEVMQFTGILDKNGKEIYEGDIVEGGGQRFIIEWNSSGAGFTHSCISKISAQDIRWPSWSARVIGNIYENPELMKPEPEKGKQS